MASDHDIRVIPAPEHHRYEVFVGAQRAGFTQYSDRGRQRIFIHTKISEEFGGRGLGGILAGSALSEARTSGLRIVPLCPFIAGYLRKHPDFDDTVDWPEDGQEPEIAQPL